MRKAIVLFLCSAPVWVGMLRTTNAEGLKLRHLISIYADEKGSGLKIPEAVACNDKSVLIVGDTGNRRLLRYTFQDKAVKGGSEIRVPQLTTPVRVQLDSQGDIYALDAKERRVVHLSPEGEFKNFVEPLGAPPPSSAVVRSFKIDSADNIYLLDVFSSRVLVIGKDGKHQRALEIPKEAGFVSDLAVDFGGNIVLLDSIKRKLYSAAKDAKSFTLLGAGLNDSGSMPNYISALRGTIFVLEGKGSSITILGQDGAYLGRQLSFGWNEGFLNYPSQLCVNEKGEMFVADRDNSRVQVFTVIR